MSGKSEGGIHMSELGNGPFLQDTEATGLVSHHGNRGAYLAAQADLMLARYSADFREQVTELLMVLAAKPGRPEIEAG